MKKFKHSGTLGDIIYSLPMVQHFGPGEFYLHLEQVDWIAKHYYGSEPSPYHRGKMDQKDYEFMYEFMRAQPAITDFKIMNNSVEITHNLDRFRPLFVGHPTNYIGTYCQAFAIKDSSIQNKLTTTNWVHVPKIHTDNTRPVVVNRTSRGWCPPGRNPQWDQWRDQELDKKARFVGLPEEYEEFIKFSEWANITYHPVKNLLELAEVIAGTELFIGNQSVALAIAQGLGVPYTFERRRDLPLERNESYFPLHTHGSTF